MLHPGRASLAFKALKAPASLRRFLRFSPSTVSTTSRRGSLPCRALSTLADSSNDLFNYTSGRWVYNEALRLKERRTAFDVDGLRRLAAESVGQNPDDIVSFSKLAEGGLNRVFLIALRDGRQMIARLPYPLTVPKYYTVASEVATIEYMRSSGVPVPKIYGYSPDSNNAAGTAYILMEFVQGSTFDDVWYSLDPREVVSVVRQLTQLESRMMSLSFPAGGSLYFTKDLEKVAPGLGIPLDDKRFCVGPDVTVELWYGRRAELDVSRGPYQSVEEALTAGAHKELAYLKHFGQPLLPIRRERRPGYKYQLQLPSYHAEMLKRYLDIAPSLIPSDPNLSRFCIRHPDLQHHNIIVSRSPDSDCKVVLIDWQHTSILPMFLLAGIPRRFQYHNEAVSQSMTLPFSPAELNELSEVDQETDGYVYRACLNHYHYVTSTQECNPLHYAAFTDPLHACRSPLFEQARAPWEGESFGLKTALIQATTKWDELSGRGVPCPVEFDAQDLRETAALTKDLDDADEAFWRLQVLSGIVQEGWVLPEDYEDAITFLKEKKEKLMARCESEEEREKIMLHWPWDDMDETNYM